MIVFSVLLMFLISSCHIMTKDPRIEKVILITLDTTRADRLGCYGYDRAKTPHLDQLAQQANIFENAICPSPTTVPSHATILTGLYPPGHSVRVTGSHLLPKKLNTIAEIFKEHQFQTAAVVSGYPVTRRFGLDQGFDFYDDSFWNELQNPPVLERKAENSIEIALDWLTERKKSKFFLWLHLWDPHTKYDPPSPFKEQFGDNLYDGEIAYLDWSLGHFFEKLKEWNIYHSSLIIVAGDHGEGLGDHGEYEHQYFLYDSTIRVPFIIKTPKQSEGKRIQEEVGLVDIFATLMDYLKIPDYFPNDGQSIRSLMEGRSEGTYSRSLYMEALSGEISLGWSPMYAIRKDGWKFIEAPLPELYNLRDDQQEMLNLVTMETARKETLRAELETMMEQLAGTEEMPEEDIDEEAMRNLASLGYISSGSFSEGRSESEKDPKRFIKIEKDINLLLRIFPEKNWVEIFPCIVRILESDPDNKLALLYAGIADYEQMKYKEALPYLEKLMTLYPDHEKGAEYLIRIYSSLKRWEEAIGVCEKSLEYYPDKHKFYVYKGGILADADRCSEALESYEIAVQLEENLPNVYYYMARCSALTGQEDQALKYVVLSLGKRIQDPRVYLRDPVFSGLKNFKEIKEQLAVFGVL